MKSILSCCCSAWVGLVLAQLVFSSAVLEASEVLRIQPIQVCSDNGAVCANPSRELFEEATAKICAQAGFDIEFLPWNTLSGSVWLDLDTQLFDDFTIFSLAGGAGNGQHPDPTVVNVWFVRSFSNGAYGHSVQTVPGVVQRNGIAIADKSFSFNGGVGRIDVLAHELGHNLGLDHTTFGAGGSSNVMSSSRQIPSGLSDIYPDGTGLDFLTAEQISQALSTSFVVPVGPPRITQQPMDRSVPVGWGTFFSVEVSGNGLQYQWQKDSVDLPGETGSSFSIPAVDLSHAGNYRVVITNLLGSVTSSNAVLKINMHEPVPVTDTIQRLPWGGAKVRDIELLANDTDEDGDDLQVLFVGFESAAGGFVDFFEGWIYYLPPAGFTNSDSFTYLISDGGHFIEGTVLVEVTSEEIEGAIGSIEDLGAESYRVSFDGIPLLNYRVEYTEDLLPPATWTTLTNLTADGVGLLEFVDTPPMGSPSRYYRSIWP